MFMSLLIHPTVSMRDNIHNVFVRTPCLYTRPQGKCALEIGPFLSFLSEAFLGMWAGGEGFGPDTCEIQAQTAMPWPLAGTWAWAGWGAMEQLAGAWRRA